jgi:hypothetical protein
MLLIRFLNGGELNGIASPAPAGRKFIEELPIGATPLPTSFTAPKPDWDTLCNQILGLIGSHNLPKNLTASGGGKYGSNPLAPRIQSSTIQSFPGLADLGEHLTQFWRLLKKRLNSPNSVDGQFPVLIVTHVTTEGSWSSTVY